ncbi:MAG: histone deacetylase [Deltaproteobacteria bacterium]|nr:histone deacetylase [Deltaproteobacteria bacterium]
MNRVGFVYHSDYLLHAAPFDHPESPSRLLAIVEHLSSNGIADRMIPIEPVYPGESDILRVHDPEYLRKLEAACRRGDTTLDAEDTYLCRNSYTIALLSAGGAIAGAEAVATGMVRRAFCAVRPPGHHADRHTGMGFCLLNNVAVAARYLQAKHGISRVFIVDWDVHHGNGTQSIFLEDPSVFFFSIHEHPSFLYPGTGRRWETGKGAGEGTTINAPMSPGTGDEEYRLAFEQMLQPAVERFRPEIIMISAGFDAHREDPLADIEVTTEGYRFMTRFVCELAERHCGGKVVSVLEGGYEIPSLVASVAIHVQELLGT